MSHPTVPSVVTALQNAINHGDTTGLLMLFPGDGEVVDFDRSFVGHAAIRGWSDAEVIGARGRLSIVDVVSANGDTAVVDTEWESEDYTGPGRFTFHIDGNRIKQLVIEDVPRH